MATYQAVYDSAGFRYLAQGMKDRDAFAIVFRIMNSPNKHHASQFEIWANDQLKDQDAVVTFHEYQDHVERAHIAIFGDDPTDIPERVARFMEEAIELGQAFGMTRGDIHALTEYTFGRTKGDPQQEIGGVITTLVSLIVEAKLVFEFEAVAGLRELISKIDRIRAKRSTRHGRGPLPGLDPDKLTVQDAVATGVVAEYKIPVEPSHGFDVEPHKDPLQLRAEIIERRHAEYRARAARMFGVKEEDVTDEQRRIAKADIMGIDLD